MDISKKIGKQWRKIKNKYPLLDEIEVVSYWILAKESQKDADKYATSIEKQRVICDKKN